MPDPTTLQTRRTFALRSFKWVAAGGLLLAAGACASKPDLESARTDVKKREGRVTKIDGGEPKPAAKTTTGKPAAKDAHGAAPAGAAKDAHGAAGGEAHWAYEGKGGPAEWGAMKPEYAVCSSGSTQSPIDLAVAQQIPGGRTNIKWSPTALSVVNNGHTIQADVEKDSMIEVDGQPFELVQFHFHAPSEHTLNGKPFAFETHFVHKSAKGELAVVGVLHTIGAENPTLAPIWGAMPKTVDEKKPLAKTDLAAMLPRDRSMFRYAGSLTTPPCSEGVRWHVVQTPTTVSQAQVTAFMEVVKANARPVQPLKARDVLKEQA